jgi:DNA-binding PadR family transcriptional regulator
MTTRAQEAVADPRRRLVLKMIAEEPASITELIQRWPQGAPVPAKIEPTVAELEGAGCVKPVTYDERRKERAYIYAITSEGKAALDAVKPPEAD